MEGLKVLVAKNFIVVSDMNIMLTAKSHALIGEKSYCGVLRYGSFNHCEDSRDRKHPIMEVNYRSVDVNWSKNGWFADMAAVGILLPTRQLSTDCCHWLSNFDFPNADIHDWNSSLLM